MTLYMLVAGPLIGDPQRREGAKGRFTTAAIRADGDEAVTVSVIAFSAEGERLLEFVKGDALAVSGRARLTSWTARDGAEKHGISLVAEQIAAAKPRPRSDERPRKASASLRPRGARRASTRSLYSPPQKPGRRSVPDLPVDRVDNLWADCLVP